MFDQTFVDSTQKTSKPLSLLVSTLIQIGVLLVLLLIPLIYTATLPGAMFKSLLVAPAPPSAPVHENAPKAKLGRMVRVFSEKTIFTPTVIPKRVNPISDAGAPPDVSGGIPDAAPKPPPLAEQPKPKPAAPQAIRVGMGVAEANLIAKVVPTYPPLAKATRIQGVVEFSATISKEGRIENLQLVRGHPLLVKAARDAVLQWRYRPTLLNGEPVEVLTDIVVNFTLTQ